MDLAVFIDGDDPNHRLPVAVAGQEHHTGRDALGVSRIGERRPAKTVVVLGVQIDDEIQPCRLGFRP